MQKIPFTFPSTHIYSYSINYSSKFRSVPVPFQSEFLYLVWALLDSWCPFCTISLIPTKHLYFYISNVLWGFFSLCLLTDIDFSSMNKTVNTHLNVYVFYSLVSLSNFSNKWSMFSHFFSPKCSPLAIQYLFPLFFWNVSKVTKGYISWNQVVWF